MARGIWHIAGNQTEWLEQAEAKDFTAVWGQKGHKVVQDYIRKHKARLCQQYGQLTSAANVLLQASASIITHACFLHERVKVLENNAETLDSAMKDLDGDIQKAKEIQHQLERASDHVESTALTNLCGAVRKVCERASAIHSLLDSLIREADSSQKEAREGQACSILLGCAAFFAGFLVPCGRAAVVLAEQVSVLRSAQMVAATSAVGGFVINGDTIERCKEVRDEAERMARSLKQETAHFISGLANYFQHAPEAYAKFSEHAAEAKAPIDDALMVELLNPLRRMPSISLPTFQGRLSL